MSKPLILGALASLMTASAYARRRGGGGDSVPWLSDMVLYVFIGLAALAVVLTVVSVLLRHFGRRSAADMARERSMRRQVRRQTGQKR